MPRFFGQLGGPFAGSVAPRDGDISGAKQIGNFQDVVAAGLVDDGLHLHALHAQDADHAARHRVGGVLHGGANCTSRSPSSKSTTPAKVSAVYSPRLRPAAASHDSTTSGDSARKASTAARLVTKIAGWLMTVESSSSAGPSELGQIKAQDGIRSVETAARPELRGEVLAHALHAVPWPGTERRSTPESFLVNCGGVRKCLDVCAPSRHG